MPSTHQGEADSFILRVTRDHLYVSCVPPGILIAGFCTYHPAVVGTVVQGLLEIPGLPGKSVGELISWHSSSSKYAFVVDQGATVSVPLGFVTYRTPAAFPIGTVGRKSAIPLVLALVTRMRSRTSSTPERAPK